MENDDEEMSFAAGDHAGPGLQATPKIPPSFDGRSSWFSYEEAVDDWVDITTLDAEKLGPSLKNRLTGDAAVYKPLLDRDRLRDPDNGVKYFKDMVRPHFVKGNQSVFLWRFYQFLRFYRGQQDLLRWIGRFTVVLKRLRDSWMDLLQPTSEQDPAFLRDLQNVNDQRLANGEQAVDLPTAYPEWIDRRRRRHTSSFPISNNLFALMFTVQADLSEQQRERLTSHMTIRGIHVQNYTFEALREAFIELFCAPKSGLDNPNYHTTGNGRSFCVYEYGECDGQYGYWVQDEETEEEGFVPEFDDVFWTFDDQTEAWISHRFKQRKLRKGKGKGKGKPKGKGRGHKGRAWFKPFNQKGRNKGKEYSDYQKGKGKGKNKGKGKGKENKGKGNGEAHQADGSESQPSAES